MASGILANLIVLTLILNISSKVTACFVVESSLVTAFLCSNTYQTLQTSHFTPPSPVSYEEARHTYRLLRLMPGSPSPLVSQR